MKTDGIIDAKRKVKNKMKFTDGKEYISQVKSLISEYTTALNRDLSFQNLDEELNDVAKKYTPPHGKIIVAVENNDVLGMVAYRKHSKVRCEMKRFYVKPHARGRNIGDNLVKKIVACAKAEGFEEMVLDTLSHMKTAIHLYKKYGFEECEPYYNNPMNDVIYMKKKL